MTDVTPVGKTKPEIMISGNDGNAFSIMGRVKRALRKTGHTAEEIDQYIDDATSGDYGHLLAVTAEWADIS